ncbi:NUDIX hydrolase [Bartonella sp. DGB1]|uniref:NUDIX hydrolase n=1 Tax=Bartonella sp. DGB1 TaxID=3239807 RepID=UPI00352316F3
MDKLYKNIISSKYISVENEYFLQVGAIAYKYINNKYEILLVTSKTSKRWIIPKGWPQKNKNLSESALQETIEEAGATGNITQIPVGHYYYEKLSRSKQKSKKIRLDVFGLEVTEIYQDWQERYQRCRQWFTADEAVLIIEQPELAQLVSDFFNDLEKTK